MSETTENAVASQWSGSFDAYHKSGLRVKLPILPGYDYAAAFAAVTSAIDAGWLAQAPGLDAGEEKESVGWVLLGNKEKDGETTPYVVLYAANEQLTWSFLTKYLNTKDDITDFEYASGLVLEKLPDYVGNDKPQRGASGKTDRFIIKAPKPFGVVFKHNPKHREAPPGEDNRSNIEKTKRLFVRWENQRPKSEPKPEQNGKQLRTLPDLVDYYESGATNAGYTPGALTDFVLNKIGGSVRDWPESNRQRIVDAVKAFKDSVK